MFTKMKIALATLLIAGAASTALANDIDQSVSAAQAAREMKGNPLPWWWNSQENNGNPGAAYALAPQTHKSPSSRR